MRCHWPTRTWSLLAIGSLVLLITSTTPPVNALPTADASFGVFVRLGDAATGSLEQIVAGLEGVIEGSDWELLTSYAVGVDESCGFGAYVLALHHAGYARAVLQYGNLAAFALPLRLAVWEDESGVHVGATNPRSLTRTIVTESGFEQQAADIVEELAALVASVPDVAPAATQYGQPREAGLISKTMGIMAGGPFAQKVETVVRLRTEETPGEVAERLAAGFGEMADDWRWKIRPLFTLDLPAHEVAILGVSGEPVEARSFDIVGSGLDETRADFTCPGLAHAAAYPVEIVLARAGEHVNVLIIDEMFRMKIYFEDAGKMKFAMNMRMPGSIEDEIRDKVEATLY